MALYYKKDGSPYRGTDREVLAAFAKDFEDTPSRIVGREELDNGLLVSTVWMGIDHNWGCNNRPLIFESMVFLQNHRGGELDVWRYSTWEEAFRGHKMLVKKYRFYKTAEEVLKSKNPAP